MKVKLLRLGLLMILILVLAGAGAIGWNAYRRYRAEYDAYRARIQPGATVAGVPVGGLSPEEARRRVSESVAAPYYQNIILHYQNQVMAVSPAADLGFVIPVQDMVDEAMAASHRYDYWQGFWAWLRGDVLKLSLDVPLRMSHDLSAPARVAAQVAEEYDQAPAEPMVDMKRLSFIPGRPGYALDVDATARLIAECVPDPGRREVTLPVTTLEPDQSPERIESMISTLGPVMERAPGPPGFYTQTLPISTTGGIAGTPRITYTGELTWTFPHLATYTGPLTTTYAYLFDPGKPGLTFNVERAVRQVMAAVQAGVTTPIQFEPDWLPPPPLKRELLIPPLEARLAEFPGVTSLLVKNLDTGEVIYNSNTQYVLSGMSIAKIGIMVEVYRHYGGSVDAQTHQELLDMLGSSSCNPCANRLMASVGGGSAQAGAQRVTATMQHLGLSNFRLCAPFRIEALGRPARGQVAALPVDNLFGYWAIPRYDRCVRATPAEMGRLVEMIYEGTMGKGALVKAYPVITGAACQEMIDIMAANDLRNMLGAGIPPDVKLAHKHGFSGYAVPWGDTRGEVGILFSPKATLLISFYIWQDVDWINWGINQPLYRDVSNMLYNFFNPDAPFFPEPPWVPEE